MSKISQDAANALLSQKKFKRGNTEVRVITENHCASLFLHGNCIADYYPEPKQKKPHLYIRHCWWKTQTTKSRLNALPNVSIQQKKGVWHLNGREMAGDGFTVKL